jgi:hypothetical protein
MDPAENFLGPYVPAGLIGLIVHGNGLLGQFLCIGGDVVWADLIMDHSSSSSSISSIPS